MQDRKSRSSIIHFILKVLLAASFFQRPLTEPSGSASRAEPPVEQQSNRTSASRLESPPISLDAFRDARPTGRWRYPRSYTRQRGILSYRVVDPTLCKAAALLCDSVQ